VILDAVVTHPPSKHGQKHLLAEKVQGASKNCGMGTIPSRVCEGSRRNRRIELRGASEKESFLFKSGDLCEACRWFANELREQGERGSGPPGRGEKPMGVSEGGGRGGVSCGWE